MNKKERFNMRNLFETDSNVKYESCFQLRKLPKKQQQQQKLLLSESLIQIDDYK